MSPLGSWCPDCQVSTWTHSGGSVGAPPAPHTPCTRPDSNHLLPAWSDLRTHVPGRVAVSNIMRNTLNVTSVPDETMKLASTQAATAAQRLWSGAWGPRRQRTHGSPHVSPGRVSRARRKHPQRRGTQAPGGPRGNV